MSATRFIHAVGVALIVVSACSNASMRRIRTTATTRDEQVASGCSTSHVAPILDTIGMGVGAFGLANAIVMLTGAWSLPETGQLLPAPVPGVLLGAPSLLVLKIYSTSRRHGYETVKRCKEERAKCSASDERCQELAKRAVPSPASLVRARCVVVKDKSIWIAVLSVHNTSKTPLTTPVVTRISSGTAPARTRERRESVALAPDERRELVHFARPEPISSCAVELGTSVELGASVDR